MKTKIKHLGLLLLSLLIFACSKESEEPVNPPTPKPEPLSTETVVSDSVIVISPNKGDISDYIISYEKNKLVLKLPQNSSARTRGSNNNLPFLKNYNTKEETNLKLNNIISIPPCKFVPTGALMKIKDIQYGTGSVAILGEQPWINEVVGKADVDMKKSFVEFFGDSRFKFETPSAINGIKYKVRLEKDTEKGCVRLKLEADFEAFKKKNVILNFKDTPNGSEKISGHFKLIGTCELSPEIRVRMNHSENSKVPKLFDVTLSGDIRLKLDAELALQLKERLKAGSLNLGTFRLPPIPLGSTPIYIQPYVILDITLGVDGEIVGKMNLYDYTYSYSYQAGYDKSKSPRWFCKVGENRGRTNNNFWMANPFTNGSYSAKIGASEDIRLGLYFQLMDWDYTEMAVGGGIKVSENLKYTYDLQAETAKRHTFGVKFDASAYLFGSLKLYAMYELIKFEEEFTADVAKWNILDTKFYYGGVETPTLRTHAISNITETTAETGGEIVAEGDDKITAKGVVYGENSMPHIGGKHTIDGAGKDSFVSKLTGLKPNTKYFVRAYATNSGGTSYGDEVSFTTKGKNKGLNLSVQELNMKVGETAVVEVTNGVATGAMVNRYDVADIVLSKDGKKITVKALEQGEVSLTVYNKTESVSIPLKVVSKEGKLRIEPSVLNLSVGQTATAKVVGANNSLKIESNSNTNIAKVELVNKELKVTALAKGSTTITVNNNDTKAILNVTVNETGGNNNLMIDKTTLTLKEGEIQTVNITSGSGKYTVNSENTNIATATLNGTMINIKGLAQGNTKIIVTDTKTQQKKEVTISVNGDNNNDIPEGVIIENGVLKKWPCDAIPENGHVIIPNSVTTIGKEVFYKCKSLSSIAIPNTVTDIEEEAFRKSGLTSIIIPNSVINLGEYVFADCENLLSVKIPNSINDIKGGSFMDCYKLTNISIPNTVVSIGREAFGGCRSLKSIFIPSSVSNIGELAFGQLECPISVSNDNKHYSDIEGVLYNKEQGKLIQCPNIKTEFEIPNTVYRIEDYAFLHCESLTSIVISDAVTGIGSSAFFGCENLRKIKFGKNVEYINSEAFLGCDSLESVIMPNSLRSIGNEAFLGCNSLKSIVLGTSVKRIGKRVFQTCRNLETIILPKTLESIGAMSFDGCESLKYIHCKAETPPNVKEVWGFSFNINYYGKLIVPKGSKKLYEETEGWSCCNPIVEE